MKDLLINLFVRLVRSDMANYRINIYKKEKMLNRVLLTSSIGGENDKHNEGSRRSGKARK